MGPSDQRGSAGSRGGARRRAAWLTLFALAMGLLEAVVVVYLRKLYYPDGFAFPIVLIPADVALAEQVREVTTILMLVAVAALAGRDRMDCFFVFAYLFGVWDIVYYAGLWLFLGWPESLLTWDILFLIPVPWLAPVVYPLIVSVSLIAGFGIHEKLRKRGRSLDLSRGEWFAAIAGSLIIVLSFCRHWRIVEEGAVPASFPAAIFAAGLVAGLLPFVRASLRAHRPSSVRRDSRRQPAR